jgi:predicted nucleotidyltransferase
MLLDACPTSALDWLQGRIMGQVMNKQETIEEITRRLVEFYQPVRIYLFGSEARGEGGPDSDLDFCVVLPDDAPQSLYRDRSIHRRLGGLQAAVDVVRLPCSDFDARAAHVVSSLPATVVREGRLLYDARRVAA